MALRENYRELLQDAAVLVVPRDGLDHATTKSIAAEVACNEVYIYRISAAKRGFCRLRSTGRTSDLCRTSSSIST